MKSLMRLLECVLADASIWCGTSTTRDFNTISRRVEHEGLSFLTISLPSYCSDFERSLADGCVNPTFFMGFHKNGALPRLFGGLLSCVFDASTGILLKEPNILAIHAVRQICLLCKKVLLPCSTEREKSAYESYLETDRSVAEFEKSLGDSGSYDPVYNPRISHSRDSDLESRVFDSQDEIGNCDDLKDRTFSEQDGPHLDIQHFRSVARLLWGSTFASESERFSPERLVPRHGPGATAERLSGNRKYRFNKWHRRLDHSFPSDLFCIPNWGYTTELDGIEFVDPEQETPVRVISVPKTLKTPRIIAIEPVCVQYTQQAVMEVLVKLLETQPLTRGKINFVDQTVNQKLALSSSIDGRYATIDLKDASDRVSGRLVWEMLAAAPHFREAVFACRSLRADVPGYGIHTLSRFASMGSALCFPIEAMVFYTIILSAITQRLGHRLTLKSLLRASEGVRVYGDDIIVPVEYVQDVCNELVRFNLRVNANKSFWTGKFRESCGLDAYDGINVTPVYVRHLLPSTRHDVAEYISAISLGNQLYKAGYWKAASYVREHVERFANVPHVLENSAILGWHSVRVKYDVQRWDSHLHRWLVKGHVVDAKARRDPLDGPSALMKFFLKRGEQPYFDSKHLERYGRPVVVRTKLRWATPY
nr:MAG: hypothetical protein 3 [Leviviridae sp.]